MRVGRGTQDGLEGGTGREECCDYIIMLDFFLKLKKIKLKITQITNI